LVIFQIATCQSSKLKILPFHAWRQTSKLCFYTSIDLLL